MCKPKRSLKRDDSKVSLSFRNLPGHLIRTIDFAGKLRPQIVQPGASLMGFYFLVARWTRGGIFNTAPEFKLPFTRVGESVPGVSSFRSVFGGWGGRVGSSQQVNEWMFGLLLSLVPGSCLKDTYKLPHRLIEKKRRDRINECIAQLKDLLPEHLKLTVRCAFSSSDGLGAC